MSAHRGFLLLCLLAPSRALFFPLGDGLAFNNTAKPEDGFSIQDKLVPCNGNLVLIDLDSDASFKDFPPAFTLQMCGSSAAAQRIQQFAVDPVWGQVSLVSPPPYLFPQTCMDGGGTKTNTSVYPWLCRDASQSFHSNQRWTFSGDRVFLNSSTKKYPLPAGGMCIAAGLPGQAPVLEAGLVLAPCDPANTASQSFSLLEDGTIRHADSGLCVDAGVIGRTLTWNGATWKSARISQKACPTAGNPALLPRDRIGAYTVGRTAIPGDPDNRDRLLVVGGDDTSNNMYWSDDCGHTWLCYDGAQPWTAHGKSFAPLLTLDALPGAPVVMAGGFDNTFSSVVLTLSLYFNFDGGASTWLRGDDLPFTGVFPGALTQDRRAVYVFGGQDEGFAVWSVDLTNYNTTGLTMIPGSAYAQGADVGRRVYIRGAISGGCFFATDFSPGVLWGAQPRVPAVSSSKQFSVASSAAGPWTTFADKAPWAPRASAAVVSSRDGFMVYVAGGVDFADGVPTGGVLTDAWAVDAEVCLLGGNGEVCSGHGVPSLDTVTCACDPGYDRTPTCDGTLSTSPTLSPSATRTATLSPSATRRGTTTGPPGGLSPGAAAGVAVATLAVVGLGAGLWVAKFGGAHALTELVKRAGLGGAGAGEKASLLRAPGRGSPQPLSAAAAAARFERSALNSGPPGVR